MFKLSAKNTFCVALDSRWPAMSDRLVKLGIPCTRWHAVTPEQLENHGPFEERLNPSQRACAASHMSLWKHVWQLGLSYAFIFEDDVLFSDDWRETLNVEEMPDDRYWDAFFLNVSEPTFPHDTWQKTTHQWFTGAYIVSRLGLHTLIHSNATLPEADLMTWNLQLKGHSYARFPWPCVQENKDSTTGTDTTANQQKLEQLLGPRLASYS